MKHAVSRLSVPVGVMLVVMAGLVAPRLAGAQGVTPSEREAIVRLRVERGGRAEDVEPLLRQADDAAGKGLPVGSLTNKIREGLAKNVDPKRIELVVGQMAAHLETADRLLREFEPSLAVAERDASVTLLAESFGSGVTPDEVRELRRQAQPSGKPMSADSLASAAKGLSFIKDAKLPVTDGTAVIVEAGRQGYRPHELLEVGRQVKRREADYQAGRASLRALRDAIARGERPDQLFRDSRVASPERPATVERPAAAPPEAPSRPERPTRPEPQRPEPQRPEPPARVERPAIPERPPGLGNR